jgi:cyclic beta-1,2-glucan synthetase
MINEKSPQTLGLEVRQSVRAWLGAGLDSALWIDQTPIRAELFSIERLKDHAKALASGQAVAPQRTSGISLTRRLSDNEAALLTVRRDVAEALKGGESITAAAEWLIDNFHVVEGQIAEVRTDLPRGYYRQLPKLMTGPFAGYPRIFCLAWAFVAHTDSLFDPEALRQFLDAYQTVEPLSIGELWAVSITMRLVLVENLRRLGQVILDSRQARGLANALSDKLLNTPEPMTASHKDLLASYNQSTYSSAFLVQLVHRLRDQDATMAPALAWLDEQLLKQGTTAEALVREEHQRQVNSSVSVRNIITSMRLISNLDWSEQFEKNSLVDRALHTTETYGLMDFATRNLYRTAIEQFARGSRLSEIEIADAAIKMAKAAHDAHPDREGRNRESDPGYYLIAKGRTVFEPAIGFSPTAKSWPGRMYRKLGIGGYVHASLILAAALLCLPLWAAYSHGVGAAWLGLLALLGLVPAIDLAIALVNQMVTRGYRATLLPGLDLAKGIPTALRTLVVVPSLLTRLDAIDEQISNLEIHHLASPDGELQFALLTDWVDAASEHLPGDEALVYAAQAGIDRLNALYGPAPEGPRFLLFHRRRTWNPGEGCWMGTERKRGKVCELNRLLRCATDTTFLPPQHVPMGIRYVITLDADTKLPRETVGRLIGKMAHPLNQPRLDAKSQRVIEGYAVLQPRVTPALPTGHEGSLFLRVFSGALGIDPYAAAVSDVYQDLFGEGTYTGKGIYDLDAFEAALKGRVPDNSLLSHDLFEGIFPRAGLASDVEVVEDFPTRYDVASLRHHRWARGDWQLLPWVFGNGPKGAKGHVPVIGRWKMLDNLRRTLSAPALVLALMAGWAMTPQMAVVWTLFLLATIVLPPLIPVLAHIPLSRAGVSLRSHLRALTAELRLALIQSGMMIVFLGDQAWRMADAIIRTLYRLGISRRQMLQWTPTAQITLAPAPDLKGYYSHMGGAIGVGVVALATTSLWGDATWGLPALFAGLWILSPALAFWASKSPTITSRRPIAEGDATALRLIARRTWRYFETFVTASDNMLPPDNFQETPEPVLAHRTSPTNIGLYLLSTASARDFGWIGTQDAVERLEATFVTLNRLTTCHGHFYNWYDTQDLRPLEPHYVSSVDSGNLAGHLIALAQACRDWQAGPVGASVYWQASLDTLALMRDAARHYRARRPGRGMGWRRLEDEVGRLERGLKAALANGEDAWSSLANLCDMAANMVDSVHGIILEEDDPSLGIDLMAWADSVHGCLKSHGRDLNPAGQDPHAGPLLIPRLLALETASRAMALAMDFTLLLDPQRLLLSIGYQSSDGSLDPSCYDLLASEARLASFIAIAKRDVPTRHWFRLGRAVTAIGHGSALISWSGSMFEYLMPSIVMRAPSDSLIEQTNRQIVGRQIDYARSLMTPWGVSESAFNVRDRDFTYQYSNFGVPGLGLKRGLADNTVIAPYATALAAMIDPQAACRNFEALEGLGARGRYGFYEALDFTPARLPTGQSVSMVRAFMAHHQGMTITAIADCLLDGLMCKRFHAEPMIAATELLLQERVPRDFVVSRSVVADPAHISRDQDLSSGFAWRTQPDTPSPTTQLLSNGRYGVMLTGAGSGYSRWGDQALTRWREDATCDDWGNYIYLRDVKSGRIWSPTYQPLADDTGTFDVIFNEDRAEFSHRDQELVTSLQVVVSAEDDSEVRRLTVSNLSDQPIEIDITTYCELVLTQQAADLAHPSFAKMFVETEYLSGLGALLATRRRRSHEEPEIWAAHLAVIDAKTVGKREFETDRARFLGRGGGVRNPASIMDGRALSGTTGAVLDPVFALRNRITLAPGGSARIDFWTMVASTRGEILDLIDKHHDIGAFERAVAMSWTQAQVQLHHLGIDRKQARQYQRLAAHMLYANPMLRPPSDVIKAGQGAQPGLWGLGISGDLPIMLVRVSDSEHQGLVREALEAVEYWRLKQLFVDLVILNEKDSSYIQDLQSNLTTLVRTSQSRPQIGAASATGHVFILRADQIEPQARDLLISIARVQLVREKGRLIDQLDRGTPPRAHLKPRPGPKPRPVMSELQIFRPATGMEYFNGIGGFSKAGKEYVTLLGPGQSTPAAWINVIANPHFGFQVSAEGGGFTWSVSSREHQITPWSNDPVTDKPGQVFYIRDEVSGQVWTPTALPIRDETANYSAAHGFGYTQFHHAANGIESELLSFVPLSDPIKIARLRLTNLSERKRTLSVTSYVEWVLGSNRAASAPFVCTALDTQTGAVTARNAWNPAFCERVAFADMAGRQTQWTCDRREFLGRNGVLAWPAALSRTTGLQGRSGAGLDPCAALQQTVVLEPGAQLDIVFLLGDADNLAQAQDLIRQYRQADLDLELAKVTQFWDDTLGKVQVKTPDRSMDIMLNGWLTYQTLACRVWARAGFYQASGAYGFRDQLQDGMALATIAPSLTRDHLLRAASRQFVEGDVQHWWLPHSGQGVRTRISDDRVWLAFAAAHYVQVTGDGAVLDEPVSFLAGPLLEPHQSDLFFLPTTSDVMASLYDHCALALDASLATGDHGLPLIGGGDWNDGMNRVGEGGQGESVWLGWLLFAALERFSKIADARGDSGRAEVWRAHQIALVAAMETHAWDGHWYRRAWYDDGTPLGSSANEECRIDSIAQAWSVLSGAAPADRAAEAMASMERELILPQEGLALLLTPPFDRTTKDPGYILGYPPGLRENGGQYTHAAMWSVMALSALGEGDKATALFWMLNPINHARTRIDSHRYKVEPYVVAADVYSASGHRGRGGWTWYTGSAGWMQRAGLESLLGLKIEGDHFSLDPCIPRTWPRYDMVLRHGSAVYEIRVDNPDGVQRGIGHAKLDGQDLGQRPLVIRLIDDGQVHQVIVTLA